jgi:hypothetical protein
VKVIVVRLLRDAMASLIELGAGMLTVLAFFDGCGAAYRSHCVDRRPLMPGRVLTRRNGFRSGRDGAKGARGNPPVECRG